MLFFFSIKSILHLAAEVYYKKKPFYFLYSTEIRTKLLISIIQYKQNIENKNQLHNLLIKLMFVSKKLQFSYDIQVLFGYVYNLA